MNATKRYLPFLVEDYRNQTICYTRMMFVLFFIQASATRDSNEDKIKVMADKLREVSLRSNTFYRGISGITLSHYVQNTNSIYIYLTPSISILVIFSIPMLRKSLYCSYLTRWLGILCKYIAFCGFLACCLLS